MDALERNDGVINETEINTIGRRNFLSKTLGCAAGLTLLAYTGMSRDAFGADGQKSKEEIAKELEEKVIKYMKKYGTCSQSSFCALNEQFDLKGDDAVPGLKPFAGGIAGRGETCGAVTGSILALGLFFESQTPKENIKSLSSINYAGEFFDKFSNEFGSTRCSAVVEHQYGRKYDFQNPDDMKLFMEAAKTGKCMEVVKNAVLCAADIIAENSKSADKKN